MPAIQPHPHPIPLPSRERGKLDLMTKVKTHFVCQSCGYQAPKWLGRCPGCQEWNTFVEERVIEEKVPERDLLGFETEAVPTSPHRNCW